MYLLSHWLMKPYPDLKRCNYTLSRFRMALVMDSFGLVSSIPSVLLWLAVLFAIFVNPKVSHLPLKWSYDSQGLLNQYTQPESALIRAGATCIGDALCSHIMELH